MRRSLFAILLVSLPLPGCTSEQINSASTKAEAACEKAVRVCQTAGFYLNWTEIPSDTFKVTE